MSVSKFNKKLIEILDQTHPDVSQGKNTRENAENFRNIVDAYRVLGKDGTRSIYDSVMHYNTGSTKPYSE